MKSLEIKEEVFEKLPDYYLGVVAVRDISNENKINEIEELLVKSVVDFYRKNKDVNLREQEDISVYRDVFRNFQMNPNKFMPSIEALGKRVQKNGELPSINSVVDLGNSLSLKYILPIGAHDVTSVEDPINIRFSVEGDTFLPLGSSEVEDMPQGELIYASGNKVKTRRWIWRQSDDGKIKETSKDVFFFVDGFLSVNKEKVQEAVKELSLHLENIFKSDVKYDFLEKNNRYFEF